MQNPIIKSVLAVILSIAVAFGLAMAVEGISSILHPWPADFTGTFEEVARQIETYPTWVLAFLGGVGYGTIVLICSFIATRLGHNRNPWHGYGVGVFLFAMVIVNMTMLPYPIWFWVLMFTVLPLAAYFGTKLADA
jgi:hypothetical protein